MRSLGRGRSCTRARWRSCSSRAARKNPASLLDELIRWVHPMLAGVGTTQDMIFTEELNTRLALPDVQRLDSGVVLLSYGPS